MKILAGYKRLRMTRSAFRSIAVADATPASRALIAPFSLVFAFA
jgi:hypothetical protein